MPKFGVNLPDDLTKQVEKPLEYGDSRSMRIRGLVEIGLAVEAAAMNRNPELGPVIDDDDAAPIVDFVVPCIAGSNSDSNDK